MCLLQAAPILCIIVLPRKPHCLQMQHQDMPVPVEKYIGSETAAHSRCQYCADRPTTIQVQVELYSARLRKRILPGDSFDQLTLKLWAYGLDLSDSSARRLTLAASTSRPARQSL
jgi:hypothetical protein